MIDAVWAFITEEDDDGAMVPARLPFVGSLPLVTIHRKDLRTMERQARLHATETGRAIHLVYFRREKITKVIRPKGQRHDEAG